MTWPFTDQVELSCQATIGGEKISVRQIVARPVYDDPIAREAIERALREQLVRGIVERWTPVIRVRM